MPGAIRAEGLVKTFGEVRALDGVDLDVPEGTVLGLLGPNGAGKTTAVRVLTTLLLPDSGRAVVAGLDVVERPDEVRRSIGLSGQFAAVDEYLTGRENLQMVGQLYQLSARDAKRRAAELLDRFNLADAADRTAKTYSGGMRRRLDLAAALVVSPPVMFMDEPTTGLDPRNRQALWEVIEELVSGGTTLLLTTQYLEEADRLAHDIAVVDHGKVIARGTSDQLKAQTGGERIEVVAHLAEDIGTTRAVLERYALHRDGRAGGPREAVAVEQHTRRLTVPVTGGAKLLAEVIRELDGQGVEIDDIGLRRPTLDDVFITLTGHAAETDGNTERATNGTPGDGSGGSDGADGSDGAGSRTGSTGSTADTPRSPRGARRGRSRTARGTRRNRSGVDGDRDGDEQSGRSAGNGGDDDGRDDRNGRRTEAPT